MTTMVIYGATAMLQAALTALHHHLLDFGDGFRRVEVFRAGAGAVHDWVAAVEPERVFELVETIAGLLVAAVGEPAIGLQQDRGSQVAFAVPPIARARGGAAEAEDAFPQPVELGAFVLRLRTLFVGRRRAVGLAATQGS